jgi:hypothetical protein
MECDASLIFIKLITSSLQYTVYPSSKLVAMEMLKYFGDEVN